MRYLNNFTFPFHCSFSGICCLSFALHVFHSLDSHSCRAFGSLRPRSPLPLSDFPSQNLIFNSCPSLIFSLSPVATQLDSTQLVSSHLIASHLISAHHQLQLQSPPTSAFRLSLIRSCIIVRLHHHHHEQNHLCMQSTQREKGEVQKFMLDTETQFSTDCRPFCSSCRASIWFVFSCVFLALPHVLLPCFFSCSLPLMLSVCYFVCPFASLQIELQRGW